MILTPDQQAEPMTVLNTQVTLLSSGEQSQGLAITRQSGEAGMGPPPHKHDWDEMFYVTSGSVDFVCDGQSLCCHSGSLICVPAGTVHGFSYGLDGGEMLEITGEGSRAPQMFSDLNDEVPPGPPDIPTVINVLGRHGVSLHS